jgi:hypothetical protein
MKSPAGEKGEWCKTTTFELATRIPMFVVAPESLGSNWYECFLHAFIHLVSAR